MTVCATYNDNADRAFCMGDATHMCRGVETLCKHHDVKYIVMCYNVSSLYHLTLGYLYRLLDFQQLIY